MDFMKVLDQAVREIKREVNLKVLKVPEIEQKVLDATSNEPWGPHGSDLAEIAQATKKFSECQMIMNVLWTRLTDIGPNWRHVYKALSVMEYLIANGSERAVDDILEHSFRISSLSSFEFVEPSGKDVGINVRKKVETILALVNDRDKIQGVRNKAAANRDKYFGLSSTGITYKSSSASYGSNSFQQNDHYGGIHSAKEDDTFKSSDKDKDQYGDEINWNHSKRDDHDKTQEGYSSVTDRAKLKKGTTQLNGDSGPSNAPKQSVKHDSSKNSSAQRNTNADEPDDFDPRGSSASESTTTNFKQVDLFGDSLIDELIDTPTSVPRETTTSIASPADEVDLFADAMFVSATPRTETSTGSNVQGPMDLFAAQPSVPASSSSSIDLFATPDSGVSIESKPPMPMSSNSDNFDPFAAIPLNTSLESDIFGDFTSHTNSASPEPLQNSTSVTSSMSGPKKEAFQVKSGIWADSLSRGLIDLNLTAPKKVSLSEVGIVGGLTDGYDEKEKRHPASYMGRGIGTGSIPGKLGFPSSTGAWGSGSFQNLGQ